MQMPESEQCLCYILFLSECRYPTLTAIPGTQTHQFEGLTILCPSLLSLASVDNPQFFEYSRCPIGHDKIMESLQSFL